MVNFCVSLSRRRRSSKASMEMKREKTSFPAMEEEGVELSLCLSIGNGSSRVVQTPEMEKRSSVSSLRISDFGSSNATLCPNPNPPPRSSSGGGAAPPPGMPCVFTTGKGPRGKTVTGYLYRYTTEEISIVCVCHGSLFSPAEFVKHAGGFDVDNPLRHITVIPS